MLSFVTLTVNFLKKSHGKSVCDRIGGNAKQIMAKASLPQAAEHQVSNASDMYQFCKEGSKGIPFIFVSKDNFIKEQDSLEDQYVIARTLQGTRSFNQFTPFSATPIFMTWIYLK